ncbi:hypothetical protein EJ04DRAFT_544374 [Polyplosphaeria fusca]|uniref:Ribosomal RNA-processing protein 8 n=1 Tax=Polyplosphaeria fusca TaxID=682080 RepID=A0A9P4V013_9PLEO|nr:hypothetical protein EJ04DRAFT_544374 [Polyplosphaeria fusca]
MFAVQGWNISAPLKTQAEVPKLKQGEGKKSQKRKKKQQDQVDEGNVGEYWEKLVEGKSSSGQEQKSGLPDTAPGVNGSSEKRGKKRKRKGSKAHKDDDEGNEDVNIDGDAAPGHTDTGVEDLIAPASMADTASKRDKKKRKKDQKSAQTNPPTTPLDPLSVSKTEKATAMVSLLPEPKGLTPLQKSMRAKLTGARFRHLNETLYTKPSKESLDLFKDNPEMFEDYHRGFAQQTEGWPENPVDEYVEAIVTRGKVRARDPWKDKKRKDKNKHGNGDTSNELSSAVVTAGLKPLPRNMKGHTTIADLGCGTASLSYRLQAQLKPLNLTLHSFDLSKPSGPTASLVTVADISALPLPESSVDVAIFCLALMGTNWLDFIDEAWRILRWRGELWVAEIKSRFGRVDRKKGKPPVNSVGSLRKDKKMKKKKTDKPEEEGIQGSDDEAELAERVDGAEGKEGTDVSAFVDALRKRGFVLDALPEKPNDAIDLSNKMFVKLQFVKGIAPAKGKNAKEQDEKGGMKMDFKNRKFGALPVADEGNDEADGKVLKPCLYKIR